MTTKPRHITTKKRHGVHHRVDKQHQLEREFDRELRRQLAALEPVAAQFPTVGKEDGPVVVFTVRSPDGGLPFRYEYKAKKGTWASAAEFDARKAIKRDGLLVHAHIETRA